MIDFNLGVAIVLGYTFVGCLITVLWSHIPPRGLFVELSLGVLWPIFLPLLIIAAFIAASVRAIQDQDGQFAGLIKDSKWKKRQL